MISARHGILQVTHFPWVTASLFPALSLVLFVVARFLIAVRDELAVGYFMYFVAALLLVPILELTVTTVRFDSTTGELHIVRRVWWQRQSNSESHRIQGLSAIVWRHRRRTPGPPFTSSTVSHDRKTLAVFDDGREVVLFSHAWFPEGQGLDRRLAEQLGVSYRKEVTGVEGKLW